ncbi:MAG: hypothetical protein R3336_01200, partial [Phycisphaeraceae bacterium]|nr:hypothetical protein [Phycisphaeraceae bacterium]
MKLQSLAMSVMVIGGLSLLGGCEDPEAASRAASARSFQSAIDAVEEARGYVPEEKEQGDEITFQEQLPKVGAGFQLTGYQNFRIEELQEATAQLEEAIAKGSREQRLTARVMLAEIHGAKARQQTREALGDWATTQVQAAKVLRLLEAAQKAAHRVSMFSQAQENLVEPLKSTREDQQEKLASLRREAEAVAEKISGLDEQIAIYQKRQETNVARATELQEESLDAKGDKRYDLQIQGIKFQRTADAAAAEAEKLRVQRDVYASELKVLKKQIELAQEAIGSLEEQIQQGQQRAQQERRLKKEAQASLSQAADKLASEYEAVYQSFQTDVYEPLFQEVIGGGGADAAEADPGAATSAVSIIEQAVSVAGKRQRELRLELLMKKVYRVRVLTDLLLASDAFGEIMLHVGDKGSELDSRFTELFSANRNNYVQRHEKVYTAASEAAADATALAEELAGGG